MQETYLYFPDRAPAQLRTNPQGMASDTALPEAVVPDEPEPLVTAPLLGITAQSSSSIG